VDGITKLLFSNYNLPVNIGNPNEMTLLELAHEILKHTGSKSKIVFKEIPVDDPRVRKPDIALAQKLLQWAPRVNLETGLKHTIQYFKKVMEYAS
jgi:dTDP-glucose 4,6-dehydratase